MLAILVYNTNSFLQHYCDTTEKKMYQKKKKNYKKTPILKQLTCPVFQTRKVKRFQLSDMPLN